MAKKVKRTLRGKGKATRTYRVVTPKKRGRPDTGRYRTVTSKSGKTYRTLKPEFKAETPKVIRKQGTKTPESPNEVYRTGKRGRQKIPVDPSQVYVKTGATAIRGTGAHRITGQRGKGFKGGFAGKGESGPVKQLTPAEIKELEREKNRAARLEEEKKVRKEQKRQKNWRIRQKWRPSGGLGRGGGSSTR